MCIRDRYQRRVHGDHIIETFPMEAAAETLTWLSHAGFKFKFPDSKGTTRVVYVDAWFGSPKCPESEKVPEKADLCLITHGHFDHSIGSLDIFKANPDCQFICNYEVGLWLKSKGIPEANILSGNKGGTIELDYCTVTIVSADHSSSCPGDDHPIIGGEALGYVIKFNGYSFYHAGDTNVFTDMKLICDLYDIKYALLPIGGKYTMGPYEAAYASLVLLTTVEKVIPMHYGTCLLYTSPSPRDS
eukprot:TRINITY_DN3595_c0_g2_i1.p1 TRINITY_DN3595_c0_g2~~TRINITY_DN3595_c0_g2_i1.p1  ORF type:complete len:244 (-),score=67.89 TRINITY_DN3595_c0_g2_i1:72-803(-)